MTLDPSNENPGDLQATLHTPAQTGTAQGDLEDVDESSTDAMAAVALAAQAAAAAAARAAEAASAAAAEATKACQASASAAASAAAALTHGPQRSETMAAATMQSVPSSNTMALEAPKEQVAEIPMPGRAAATSPIPNSNTNGPEALDHIAAQAGMADAASISAAQVLQDMPQAGPMPSVPSLNRDRDSGSPIAIKKGPSQPIPPPANDDMDPAAAASADHATAGGSRAADKTVAVVRGIPLAEDDLVGSGTNPVGVFKSSLPQPRSIPAYLTVPGMPARVMQTPRRMAEPPSDPPAPNHATECQHSMESDMALEHPVPGDPAQIGSLGRPNGSSAMRAETAPVADGAQKNNVNMQAAGVDDEGMPGQKVSAQQGNTAAHQGATGKFESSKGDEEMDEAVVVEEEPPASQPLLKLVWTSGASALIDPPLAYEEYDTGTPTELDGAPLKPQSGTPDVIPAPRNPEGLPAAQQGSDDQKAVPFQAALPEVRAHGEGADMSMMMHEDDAASSGIAPGYGKPKVQDYCHPAGGPSSQRLAGVRKGLFSMADPTASNLPFARMPVPGRNIPATSIVSSVQQTALDSLTGPEDLPLGGKSEKPAGSDMPLPDDSSPMGNSGSGILGRSFRTAAGMGAPAETQEGGQSSGGRSAGDGRGGGGSSSPAGKRGHAEMRSSGDQAAGHETAGGSHASDGKHFMSGPVSPAVHTADISTLVWGCRLHCRCRH